jgi:hypothetical protein
MYFILSLLIWLATVGRNERNRMGYGIPLKTHWEGLAGGEKCIKYELYSYKIAQPKLSVSYILFGCSHLEFSDIGLSVLYVGLCVCLAV